MRSFQANKKVKMPMVISAGLDKGQHDTPIDAEFAATVDARRIGDFFRNRAEELPHEEDVEGAAAEKWRHHQRQRRYQSSPTVKTQ